MPKYHIIKEMHNSVLAIVVYMIVRTTPACFQHFYIILATIIPTLVEIFYIFVSFFANNNIL